MTAKKNEKLNEVLAKLEDGVKSVFLSDRYREYLHVMGHFHHYSAGNCVLIATQNPNARKVAGYRVWQTKFDRQVKKGEKAIWILAPCPYKKRVREIISDENGKAVLDKNGQPLQKEKEKTVMAFRPVPVFDVAQTDGKPLPTLAEELKNNVSDYDELFEALKRFSDVPIEFKEINNGANGYYNVSDKRIAIRKGMEQAQNIKTCIHELSHRLLHDYDTGALKDKEIMTLDMEIQAESTAFVVCDHFGIDTSDYSFGYVAGWSASKSTTDLKKSLGIIRKASSEIIRGTEEKLQEIRMERTAELAFQLPDNKNFYIKKEENGYQYSLFQDGKFSEKGELKETEIRIDEAADRIFRHLGMQDISRSEMPVSDLQKIITERKIADITKTGPVKQEMISTQTEAVKAGRKMRM